MKQFNEYKEQVKVLTITELVEAKKHYEGIIENIKAVAGQFGSADDEYFKHTTILMIIEKELEERV